MADSWRRSIAAGVDAQTVAPTVIAPDELPDLRQEHRLAAVYPLLADVLGRAAEACESVLAVTDADVRLLWVHGTSALRRKADGINFVEGSWWDEARAGTNAVGTALALDAPVTIAGTEHFADIVQPWNCAAAPIHDPIDRSILGIVDVTGGPAVASPQTIAMVQAAARMAESELGRLAAIEAARVAGRPPVERGSALRLEGLGRPDCVVTVDGRTFRLTPRHSEIVALLAAHPNGLSGNDLVLDLYTHDMPSVTVRAELVRLRGLLGAHVLASRPYRLCGVVESDWRTVEAHLDAGRVQQASRLYRGPLLPTSQAPGVVELRAHLERRLRDAVLMSGRPDLMSTWTRSQWGSDDVQMWQRQIADLPIGSPLHPIAAAHIARLDAELR